MERTRLPTADLEPDPGAPALGLTPAELEDEIRAVAKRRNAVILAHYYQESEIQDIADFVGDSLQLSQQAAKTQADVIAFCGVHFMAETAKILNPTKTVVVPDLEAGCSLADGCPAPAFERWLKQYPDHTVVSYINCSAEVKAMSDVIVTSSNAVKIVKALAGQKIVFAPDRFLGAFVAREAQRPDLVLWQGACIVHESFSERRLIELKLAHPDAVIIAHPECHDGILRHAQHVASTSGLISYVAKSPAQTFIVATEVGIMHKMQQEAPGKTLIAAPPDDESCSCNTCPFMRLNTMEKLYLALRNLSPQVDVPAPVRERALRPIQRMLEMSA